MLKGVQPKFVKLVAAALDNINCGLQSVKDGGPWVIISRQAGTPGKREEGNTVFCFISLCVHLRIETI